MSSGTPDNARIWTDAVVSVGEDLDVVLPTTILGALAAGFHQVSLVSEDGFSNPGAFNSSEDKYAYGGILLRTIKGKYKESFKFTAVENNGFVWQLRNPGSTSTTTAGITTNIVRTPNPSGLFLPFVLDFEDGPIHRRRVIPKGQVFRDGDGTIVDNDIEHFGFEVAIIPDAGKVLYIDLTDDPAAPVTVTLG